MRPTLRIAAAGLASTAAVALIATTAPTAQAAPSGADRAKPGARIVGGGDVSNDAYPFMVALLSKGKGNAKKRQFCGGSLVNPYVVMTAAHCVDHQQPKNLQVAVGRTVLSNAQQGQIRNIRKPQGEGDPGGIVVHPRYAKGEQAYDVAFLELAKPVTGIKPIKMPTAGTDALIRPGAKATVIGWGNTDTDLPHSPDRLRKVNVPILSHNECKVAYSDYDRKVNICAGKEGKDSCQGDSGGPIFRKVPGREDIIQIGVVSWGDGCAEQGAPGVYTSTSSAKLWNTLGESPEGKRLKQRLKR
ncbi:S1 family peptidase [Streptomyces gobiensis]|uniref:S1 family peptidase n=1 Tax=Streptomyces gobiensis TaxID=2875706 RepID=UPI001E2F6CBF|nr:serine protease [Streptomyces gobiensis]UGY92056.1 serine protease [Streptomyces gobiensis]